MQVVPAIVSRVGELRVFQRTPNWFFPKMDPVYPSWLKQVFCRVPFLMTVQRIFFFYMVEGWALLWLTKVLSLTKSGYPTHSMTFKSVGESDSH